MTTAPAAQPAAAKDGHGCLPRGYRLREFVIERVLGDGGFGVVYSALDLRLERRVAIKEYMPSSLARRDTDYSVQMLTSPRHRDAFEVGLRSFINEARLLARFEHPALVKVHQFWQEKGTAYMVMPFYAAPTLRHWVRARHEPVGEAWLQGFLLRAMEAVEVLHAESCLHRDIAPDNILVLKDALPLLLDFGAARRVIGDLRKALTVIVKPGFAPLEQYADTVKMQQGPWTDVYALAAVAHFVLTGQAPAPAVSRVLADEYVPLRTRLAGRYSDALLGAIDTALAVKPERRPQSIAAFRDLMQSTQAGEWEPTRFVGGTGDHAAAQASAATEARPIDARTQAIAAQAAAPAPAWTSAQLADHDAPTVLLRPASADSGTFVGHVRAPDIVCAPAPAPRSLQLPATQAPTTLPASAQAATPAATQLTTLQRTMARLADAGTLTQAVRETFSPDKPHARWVGCAGYALALVAFGGVLYLTATLAERYVANNSREALRPAAVVVQPAVTSQSESASARTETGAVPQAIDVALAPVLSETPVQSAAPVLLPPTVATVSTARPKTSVTTRIAPVERPAVRPAHEPAQAALRLTAPAAARDARKTRGAEELVVPIERANIADVAPVELVVAAPAEATVAPAQPEPLRIIARTDPQFPVAAANEGVRDGRVVAEVTVNGDGSVGHITIVEAQPRNVFDKEVRRALAAWRYAAPGQPRQAAVEFVFRREP